MKGNRICFTLNNPTGEETANIISELNKLSCSNSITYAIVGRETAPSTGTPHLQGFVSLKPSFMKSGSGTVSKWKRLIPGLERSHMEKAYGSDQDSKEYCSKESVIFEVGTPAEDNGRGGIFGQLLSVSSLQEAQQVDPELRLKHHFQLKDILLQNFLEQYSAPETSVPKLTRWQYNACWNLITQNNRAITWIVDERGGRGKTTLRDFLTTRLGSSCFFTTGGKNADILHALVQRQTLIKYVVFDYPRHVRPEFYNWKLLEDFKNGDICSGKYNSVHLKFPSIKVLVLGNHPLDGVRDRLTYDRWDVHILGDLTDPTPNIDASDAFAGTDLFPDVTPANEDLIEEIFSENRSIGQSQNQSMLHAELLRQ